MRKKRYFLVAFTANSNTGNLTGNIDITSNGGGFLNRFDTIENIKESLSEYNASQIVITNIIELTNSDFKNWIKKTPPIIK